MTSNVRLQSIHGQARNALTPLRTLTEAHTLAAPLSSLSSCTLLHINPVIAAPALTANEGGGLRLQRADDNSRSSVDDGVTCSVCDDR